MFDFPASPALGQQVTNGSVTYQWDAAKWIAAPATPTVDGPYLPLTGGTVTGATTFSATGTALTVTNSSTFGGTLTSSNTLSAKFITGSRTSNFTTGQVFGDAVSLWSVANTTGGAIGSGSGSAASYLLRTLGNAVDASAQTNGFWNAWFDKREAATKGNQGNVNVLMTQTANTADTGSTFFWVASQAKVDLEFTDGGAGGTAVGNAIAFSPIVFMGAAAKWGNIEVIEAGINRTAGSVATQQFVQVMNITLPDHATTGIEGFFALASGRGAAVGMNTGFSIARGNEQWPFAPTGTWWKAFPQTIGNPGSTRIAPQVLATLYDVSNVRFTDSLIKSASGIRLGSAADVYVGPLKLSAISGGGALDSPGAKGGALSVTTPGIAYQVNDEVYPSIGGIARVSAVSGGGITALAWIVGSEPYDFSGSAPTSGITVKGGSGSGAVLSVVWAAQSALSLQPSGGVTTIGGGLILAGNPTVALQAATKAYVDAAAPVGGPYLPLTGGTVSGATTFSNTLTASGGLTFAGGLASSVSDLSKHINLLSGYGVSATASRINIVSGGATWFNNAGTDAVAISNNTLASYVGLAFGSTVASGPTDFTKHIALYGNQYGLSVTGGRLNHVAASGGAHVFMFGSTDAVTIGSAGTVKLAQGLGLFNGTPIAAKPAVSGSRGGNAALASLLTALASYGLVTDSTTA